MASGTFYTEDMKGAAKFYILSSDEKAVLEMITKAGRSVIHPIGFDAASLTSFINIDFVISDLRYTLGERHTLSPMLFDFFGSCFKGRAPVTLEITGTLLDESGTYNKYNFMLIYKDLFRVSKVARHKIPLWIEFVGAFAQGAFLSVSLSETNDLQNAINLTCSFLLFDMFIVNTDNKGVYSISKLFFTEDENGG